MNIEKLIVSSFIILATTLNFGFFYGNISSIFFQNKYQFIATIFINLLSLFFCYKDKSEVKPALFAASFTANLQLVLAVSIWLFSIYVEGLDLSIIFLSLVGGALLSNFILLSIYIFYTLKSGE